MAINEKVITSVTDFIKEINDFKKDKKIVWYRGHSESNYKLLPSIFRKPFSASSEKELTNQFKSRANPYLEKSPSAKNYWEWLCIMQHYKIPTRLLDWTESALVALAFAVIYRDNKKRNGKNVGAHVWCLDPIKLNSKFNLLDNNTIPFITDDSFAIFLDSIDKMSSKGELKTPIAVFGPRNNPRIVGQKGVFTIFPPLNDFQIDESIGDIGQKLVIKSEENVKSIASELYDLGISESMIFPELDSISSEIKREHIANLTSSNSHKRK